MRYRKAVATLELVMALPILLTLMVGLIWLGFSVIGQAEVNVEARDKAWQKRFDRWQGTKFDFTSRQLAEENAETDIVVSPVLDQLPGPSSNQSLDSSTWDHRSIEFKDVPNFRLAGEVVLAAKTQGIRTSLRDIKETFASAQELGRLGLGEMLREIASELTNPFSQLESGANSGQQRLDLDEALAKAERTEKLREIADRIRKINDGLGIQSDEDDEVGELSRWLEKQKIKRLKIEQKLLKDSQ